MLGGSVGEYGFSPAMFVYRVMGDHSWLSVGSGDSVPLRVFMVRLSRFTARTAAVAASVPGAYRTSYQASGLQMSPEGAAAAGQA